MGYTELLSSPELFSDFTDGQKQDFLAEIYERGEALSRIIDDLLDISRIESGHPITLDRQETDLLDILVKTGTFYRFHDATHAFRLELPDDPDEPVPLQIDRQRINQVLENLLSNAMKYSPKGSEILLKGQQDVDGWLITVEDQGIGMTEEQVDRIFDKFYRVDSSNTAVGGLGLGMSIVRQIVEAHGGTIWVKSQFGKGTQVSFTLPKTSA